MKLAYIAGAISAPTENERMDNIRRAVDVAAHIIGLGYAVFVPHTMSELIDALYPQPYEFWMDNCLRLLQGCDLLVLVPGYGQSEGTRKEIDFAYVHGIPVHINYECVPKVEEVENKQG